jgi:hypothetical protein
MTDKLAIWLSGGSLLVSLASFVLATMAKRQAQKTATLGLRTEAINHVHAALHDLNVDKARRAGAPIVDIVDIDDLLASGGHGTVRAKTADHIRKALNLFTSCSAAGSGKNSTERARLQIGCGKYVNFRIRPRGTPLR